MQNVVVHVFPRLIKKSFPNHRIYKYGDSQLHLGNLEGRCANVILFSSSLRLLCLSSSEEKKRPDWECNGIQCGSNAGVPCPPAVPCA